MEVVVGMIILVVVSIASLIYWYKKIDSETTWIYGIYIFIMLTFSLFVLKALEQYWLTHG